uniref:(northern house mosquito) hypothetical protein n=1 Tax=Culex pipiens TaxID=7175 RepID=A0A8D8CJ19_CULPI
MLQTPAAAHVHQDEALGKGLQPDLDGRAQTAVREKVRQPRAHQVPGPVRGRHRITQLPGQIRRHGRRSVHGQHEDDLRAAHLELHRKHHHGKVRLEGGPHLPCHPAEKVHRTGEHPEGGNDPGEGSQAAHLQAARGELPTNPSVPQTRRRKRRCAQIVLPLLRQPDANRVNAPGNLLQIPVQLHHPLHPR